MSSVSAGGTAAVGPPPGEDRGISDSGRSARSNCPWAACCLWRAD